MLLEENSLPISPILAPIVAFLVQSYYKIVQFVYFLMNVLVSKQVVPLPTEDEQLVLLSVSELAEKIRCGEIKSTEVVETYINRIEAVNKIINAIVQRNFDDARQGAKKVNEYLESLDKNSEEFRKLPDTKPLLGIPFSVKDHLNVKGLKITVGLPCFKDVEPSKEDAVLIKNLRKAGGLPICVTNVPEGVMWFEGLNTIYGRTLNPYDSRKSCGGSSSGEGALIGSGSIPFGIGTDIAGSIRAPALFNGIFGLKPGPGLTNMTGFIPEDVHGYQAKMIGVGPMCKHAFDLNMLLKLFIGPENSQRLKLDEPVDVSTIKFYSMAGLKNYLTSPTLDSDVLGAFNNAIAFFEQKFEKTVIPVDFPLANYAANYWFEGFTSEESLSISNFFTGFTTDKRLNVFEELPKWFKGESEHITAVLLACLIEEFAPAFKVDRKIVIAMREKFRKHILDLLGDDGVLIWPSFPRSGYYHNEPLWQFLSAEYTAIWNSICLPAIACPMGLNENGFPTGIQMICGPDNERLLIAAACELENGDYKWTHPRA